MPFLYDNNTKNGEETHHESNGEVKTVQEDVKRHTRRASFWPKMYRRFGFTKPYNFWLCQYLCSSDYLTSLKSITDVFQSSSFRQECCISRSRASRTWILTGILPVASHQATGTTTGLAFIDGVSPSISSQCFPLAFSWLDNSSQNCDKSTCRSTGSTATLSSL